MLLCFLSQCVNTPSSSVGFLLYPSLSDTMMTYLWNIKSHNTRCLKLQPCLIIKRNAGRLDRQLRLLHRMVLYFGVILIFLCFIFIFYV